MLRYLFRRVLISIPTLIAISMVLFLVLALAPGDPIGEFAANAAIPAEVRDQIRQSLGLDQPIPVRYGKWAIAFLRGEMGYSFTSRIPVRDLIAQRLPVTLAVVGTGYLLSVAIALPLGILSALKRHTWIDRLATTIAFLGFSLPTFFTGLVLILIFSVQLRWLPFIYDSTLVVRDWPSLVAQIKQSIMPVSVLALYQAASLMRYIRGSVLEELDHDYVRTAHAKGLLPTIIVYRHILRNALIPVVTLMALEIPAVLTGALVTEQVFRVPGIGALLIEAIQRSDTPVVMSITFIYAIAIVLFNLIADVLYGVLDPRVQLSR